MGDGLAPGHASIIIRDTGHNQAQADPVNHCFNNGRCGDLILKIGKEINEPADVSGKGLGSPLAELLSFLREIDGLESLGMGLEERLFQL